MIVFINKKLLFSLVIFVLLAVISAWSVRNKLTYLEFADINQDGDTFITVKDSHDILVQDFIMPYDIMHGFSVQIGTFAKDNNSEWETEVYDPQTHRTLYSKQFNASLLADNGYYYVEFDKNIRLTKNAKYQLRISARKVDADTALAYYVSNGAKNNLSLTVDGSDFNGTLCLKIYGGDKDEWWTGFVILLSILVFQLMYRICFVSEIRKIKWFKDTVVQSYTVGLISILLLFTFCVSGQFTDETDNIIGGIIISKGGVLYRDYVTQHTPFVYYLCSIFALFGAKSVEQFRLSYYLGVSVIWALLYLRHKSQFGRKMFYLPIAVCIIINSMDFGLRTGCMVLSDNVEGICFVALLLEFLRFLQDNTLHWDRAAIVSACVWASLGSAFVSAFALMWIAIAFFIVELKRWNSETVTINKLFNRYWEFTAILFIPLLLARAYFALNHALNRAFDQFYSFNREVYSKYIGGFGTNILTPFVSSAKNFVNIIVDHFNALMTGKATTSIVLQLLVLFTSVSIFICLLTKRQYLKPLLLFAILCCAGVRGFTSFHGMAAWYVAVMIAVLFYDEFISNVSKLGSCVLVFMGVYSLSMFVNAVGDNLLYKQSPVPVIDHDLVLATEGGDKILVDSFCFNSLYLLYKNHSIVNRAQYILPWYMDWYEQDTIDDLLEQKPYYVLFNEKTNVWGQEHFANSFLKALKQNYSRASENPADGWKYFVWKIKE